jgi:hypothetical protein
VSRHLDDLEAVLEFDASDEFGQLVFALQTPPGFCRRTDQLEHHEAGGLGRQRSFCPHGSMAHRREHAFNRVRGAQVVPVLGGKVEEGEQRLAILGRSLVRQATALSYLPPYLSANASIAASAAARVDAP